MKRRSQYRFRNISGISRLVYTRHFKDVIFLFLGAMFASIGLRGFLLPNNYLDGGAMGVALLVQILTNIELSYLILLINLPFILFGAKQISYLFALKSTLAIIFLSVLVYNVSLPIITNDKLLTSVFGGVFLGAGIGFSIRGGAVIDGTEVLAISVSRRSSLTVGDFITLFNVVLFGLAIALTSVETAMYSMLTYASASKTADFIIYGIEEYIGVLIVSRNPDAIKKQITLNIRCGVTVIKSERGYGSSGEFDTDEGNILFCVVTRLEVTNLLLEIDKIDNRAFVVQYPIRDTKGGLIKKRPLR